MRLFKADLHIHTVLSPCGSLDMTPEAIVKAALSQSLDIIGITDHNSTRQCRSVLKAAKGTPLTVFTGVEVTTREEIHCLAFFENLEILDLFQDYLDQYLPAIVNNPGTFGHQVVVDVDETILYEEPRLLISGIDQSIDQIAVKIAQLNGIFIPAHINKTKYSIISQLGFIPPSLKADAYEQAYVPNQDPLQLQALIPQKKYVLQNSDAHIPEAIGTVYNLLQMEQATFNEFKMALHNQKNRKVVA